MKRGSGLILPIFSLPHSYGIGSLGHEAYNFIDYLKDSGLTYWQLLPLGPTSIGMGNSPYSSLSSFAGNPYFIDYDILNGRGLLKREEYIYLDNGNNYQRVNYDLVHGNKEKLLRIAHGRFKEINDRSLIDEFYRKNEYWLRDYALYMVLRDKFGPDWSTWPDEYADRHREALEVFFRENEDEINFHIFTQYMFFDQYMNLKKYANDKGIKIIGDIPIYVAFDSADCWAYSKYFQLNREHKPMRVSGAPPDEFNGEGQKWGHPLYDWKKLRANGYKFWLERMNFSNDLFDIIRLDHFIGFVRYFSVPPFEESAKNGRWEEGPGREFFEFLIDNIYDLKIIVEDLGVVTREVINMKDHFKFPGMNVIQFAFSGDKKDYRYLPHNYKKNSCVYSSIHDSQTFVGWLNGLGGNMKYRVRDYLFIRDSYMDGIKYLMSSKSDLCMFSFQDLYGLDDYSRINIPGESRGQWEWRIDFFYNREDIKGKIRYFNKIYMR